MIVGSTLHTLFWFEVQGGLFWKNFWGVPYFWVLLHFMWQFQVFSKFQFFSEEDTSLQGVYSPVPPKWYFQNLLAHPNSNCCRGPCHNTSNYTFCNNQTFPIMLHNLDILKPRYIEQVCLILFVHYIEIFAISNVICLVNPQNRSWFLFTHYIKKFTISRLVISRIECIPYDVEGR